MVVDRRRKEHTPYDLEGVAFSHLTLRVCQNAFWSVNNSFALAGRIDVTSYHPRRCLGLVATLRLQRAAISCILTHPHAFRYGIKRRFKIISHAVVASCLQLRYSVPKGTGNYYLLFTAISAYPWHASMAAYNITSLKGC